MHRRRQVLPWLVSAAVMAVFIPTLAWGNAERAPVASFTAHDGPDRFESSQGGTSATIKTGETVSFGYLTGSGAHNVVFSGSAPTTCTQTAGANLGPVPPLPHYVSPAGWAGECRFDTAGTYDFVCAAHPAMTGTITVEPGGTATATQTATATSTATQTSTPSVTATQTPTATPPVVVPATPTPVATATPEPVAKLDKPKTLKRKTFVKSGLKVSGRCTSGKSGKVKLTVAASAAKKIKLKGTTLATGTAKCDGSGRMTATLKPSAAAKKALKRQRKALSTTVTLTVGTAKASAKVTLK